MGDFYTHSGYPAQGSAGISASMRAELQFIQAGFDKLPALTGNATKALVVNGSGTAVVVTAGTLTLSGNFTKAASHALTLTTTATTSLTLPTAGTLATLAGTETFTNKTITAPVFSGTATGTYTLGGTPTIASPIFSGASSGTYSLGGTYTLGGTVTLASAILSGTTSGTATLGGALTLNTSVNTGHYIGSPSSLAAFNWSLSKTGGGGAFAYGLSSSASVVGGVSDSIIGYSLNTTITKAASGTHTLVDGLFIGSPTISGSAAASVASTVRISGAPASGATTLYALNVAGGTSFFNGLLDITGASGGQIKFPSTQNASSDVNTLDDYEEGTWTPSVGGSATYTTQTGRYTKIGRLVFINCVLTINAIGTGSTSAISGLPFSANAASDFGLVVADFNNLATSIVTLLAKVNAGASTLALEGLTAAGTTPNTSAIFGSGTFVLISGCYEV